MIVHVVLLDTFGEGSSMCGVFSSLEKANAYIEQELDLERQNDYFVIEEIVDEPT